MTILLNRMSECKVFEGSEPFLFEESGRKGLRMSDGKVLLSPLYDYIQTINDCASNYVICIVGKDDKYGLFEVAPERVIRRLEVEYSSIEMLEGYDFLICKDGKYGLYDWCISVPCEYDEITLVKYDRKCKIEELKWTGIDKYYLLRKSNKYGIFSNVTDLIPTIYDEILPPIDKNGIRARKDGEWGNIPAKRYIPNE